MVASGVVKCVGGSMRGSVGHTQRTHLRVDVNIVNEVEVWYVLSSFCSSGAFPILLKSDPRSTDVVNEVWRHSH